jgi:hypothetical protein
VGFDNGYPDKSQQRQAASCTETVLSWAAWFAVVALFVAWAYTLTLVVGMYGQAILRFLGVTR